MNIHAAVAGETSQLEREPGFRDADPDYPRGGAGVTGQLKRKLGSKGTVP